MGYDMNWVREDLEEVAAIAKASAEFHAAAEARAAAETDEEKSAAQSLVDELYEKLHEVEKSYFRANIWTMSRFISIMKRMGMLDTSYRHAEFPAYGGWDNETGEPTPEVAEILSGYNPADGRIVEGKFGSNDGWLVTPEEIRNSLQRFEKFTDPRSVILAIFAIVGDSNTEAADYFLKFVEWMRAAADHDGFRVY